MGIRQVKRPVASPCRIAGPQGVRPRPNHDQFNPLMTLQFETETSKLRPLQERERMSSVLKKRRKKMRTIRVSVSEGIRDCSGSEHSRFFCARFRAMLPSV